MIDDMHDATKLAIYAENRTADRDGPSWKLCRDPEGWDRAISKIPPVVHPGAPWLYLRELRYRILPDGTEVPDSAINA